MVRYIQHKGKKLPLKVGYGAMMLMMDEMGMKDMKELQKRSADLKVMESLFFYSLKSGHVAEQLPFNIKREESIFIWEDHTVEFGEMMNEAWREQGDSKKKEVNPEEVGVS